MSRNVLALESEGCSPRTEASAGQACLAVLRLRHLDSPDPGRLQQSEVGRGAGRTRWKGAISVTRKDWIRPINESAVGA